MSLLGVCFLSAGMHMTQHPTVLSSTSRSMVYDVRPEEDCSPAVETSAFDDEFLKPIRGW